MMKKKAVESIGIFLFSVCIALITNYFRPDGLPLVRSVSSPLPFLSENELGRGVTLQIFLEKLNQSGVLILDARSPEEFQEGHVPGAKKLPYEYFSEKSPQILQGIPFDQEIITYCEGIDCSNAEDLTLLLKEMGYKNVKVFPGGWEEWTENRMPVEE
ncbi:MAG: rhodanese-like domain-containing protein [Pseudomonadota bacterium]